MRFASAIEAIRAELRATAFDVVVTDLRMPGINGAQLLDTVRSVWPNAGRIILSGGADPTLLEHAKRSAHVVLIKPCERDILRGAIDRWCPPSRPEHLAAPVGGAPYELSGRV